jgi:hypothetical protein
LQELLRALRICHQRWRITGTPRDNFPRNFLACHFFHRRNHLLHRRTLSGTGESVVNPQKYFRNNVEGGLCLFNTVLEAGGYTRQTRIFRQALPAVSLAPQSLTFGPQTINTTSSPQTVTLTNTGAAMLALSNIGITGTDASDFAQTNTCGPTLAPNDNCQVR